MIETNGGRELCLRLGLGSLGEVSQVRVLVPGLPRERAPSKALTGSATIAEVIEYADFISRASSRLG